ncbi:hypothetical protein Taro_010108 [Colocasia esculenta]|uniref:Aminotransferase-like plant mobile domain-containing protein n=1 Tax=Colocasia esculenta TaxID=4460 RepID=A0A843U6Q9_COLES|nr:hypothetical protein [Colocasia esculenta]
MQGKFGRVEEFLAAGEAGDPHTKLFFFPVVSAATCTDSHLEVDQRASSVDTTWISVDTLSQISPEGVLGRPLVSTLPDLVSTHCPILDRSMVSTPVRGFKTELDQTPNIKVLDLGEVGGYAWGAAFLAHQFESLGSSDRQTVISGFYPFLQVWAYLHLPGLRRGTLERPGLVPIARRWVPCRDTHPLGDQLASLQDAIDIYPHLDVVWRPYLEEGDEGQPWLVQARPYFDRSVLVHAIDSMLCYLYTCTCPRGRSAYVRVQWSSPAETGPLGLVRASGDFTTLPTGMSR